VLLFVAGVGEGSGAGMVGAGVFFPLLELVLLFQGGDEISFFFGEDGCLSDVNGQVLDEVLRLFHDDQAACPQALDLGQFAFSGGERVVPLLDLLFDVDDRVGGESGDGGEASGA